MRIFIWILNGAAYFIYILELILYLVDVLKLENYYLYKLLNECLTIFPTSMLLFYYGWNIS